MSKTKRRTGCAIAFTLFALAPPAQAGTWYCGGRVGGPGYRGEAVDYYATYEQKRFSREGAVTRRRAHWEPAEQRTGGEAASADLKLIYDTSGAVPALMEVKLQGTLMTEPVLAAGVTTAELVVRADDAVLARLPQPARITEWLAEERRQRGPTLGRGWFVDLPSELLPAFAAARTVELEVLGDGGRSLGSAGYDLADTARRDALLAEARAAADAELADPQRLCAAKGWK